MQEAVAHQRRGIEFASEAEARADNALELGTRSAYVLFFAWDGLFFLAWVCIGASQWRACVCVFVCVHELCVCIVPRVPTPPHTPPSSAHAAMIPTFLYACVPVPTAGALPYRPWVQACVGPAWTAVVQPGTAGGGPHCV